MCCFSPLLFFWQVQSEYLEIYKFEDPLSTPTKLNSSSTPNWYDVTGAECQDAQSEPCSIARIHLKQGGVGQIAFGDVEEDVAYSITGWGRIFKIELPSLKGTPLVQLDTGGGTMGYTEFAITVHQFQLPDRVQTRVHFGAGILALAPFLPVCTGA